MKHLLFLGIAFAAFQISHSNTPDFCNLPSDPGEGTEFDFALYYDANDDLCYPFLYKGQGGNENRFANEKECIRNCSTDAQNIYPTNEAKACLFKRAIGTRCSNQLLRYYYDSSKDVCKKFHWSGCNGNGNRFRTIESCNATCAGVHDDDFDDPDDETDTPFAIIFGVLLAVIIVTVITVVVVLTLKSKKKGSKKIGKGKSKEPKVDVPLQDQGIEMA